MEISQEKYDKTMKRLHEHYILARNRLDDDEYILATVLFGSQNYNLDHKYSDLDSKTIILPSFMNFCAAHPPLSTCWNYGTENLYVKDLRALLKEWRKCGIESIEMLYSPYVIVNPNYVDIWEELKTYRHELLHCDEYKLLCNLRGEMMAKLAECNKLHEPAIRDDPHVLKRKHKAAAQALRLAYLIETIIRHKDRDFYWIEEDEDGGLQYVRDLKMGKIPYENYITKVSAIVKNWYDKSEAVLEDFIPDVHYQQVHLDVAEVVEKAMKRRVLREFEREEREKKK